MANESVRVVWSEISISIANKAVGHDTWCCRAVLVSSKADWSRLMMWRSGSLYGWLGIHFQDRKGSVPCWALIHLPWSAPYVFGSVFFAVLQKHHHPADWALCLHVIIWETLSGIRTENGHLTFALVCQKKALLTFQCLPLSSAQKAVNGARPQRGETNRSTGMCSLCANPD